MSAEYPASRIRLLQSLSRLVAILSGVIVAGGLPTTGVHVTMETVVIVKGTVDLTVFGDERPEWMWAQFRRDNGDNSTSVGFIQGAASIEQDISGFTIGQDYVLSLDFNARNCCGDMPIAMVELDGAVVASSEDIFPPTGAVPPVGGDEPWYHADIDFTASDTTLTLLIRSAAAAAGDATFLVDNVSIVPEPATGLLAMGGLLSLLLLRRRT